MFSSGFYTHCCSKSASARTREPFFRLITHPTCWGAVRLPACPPPLTHMNQNDPNILSATASHYTPPEGRLTVAIKNRGLIFVMTVSKCAKRAANCSSFCTHFSSCKMSPQNAFLLPKSIHIQRCCNLFQLSGLLFRSHVAWFAAECGRCWLCDTRNVTAEKQSTKLEQITAPLYLCYKAVPLMTLTAVIF